MYRKSFNKAIFKMQKVRKVAVIVTVMKVEYSPSSTSTI